MNILSTVVLILSGLFAFSTTLAIGCYLQEAKLKRLLAGNIEENKHHLFETRILQEIQDKIGYSLDVEKVLEMITRSMDNLLPYSVVSSIVVKSNKLVVKTQTKGAINPLTLQQLKQGMFKSLSLLTDKELPTTVDEDLSQTSLSENTSLTIRSFFHVPFFVSQRGVGLLTIASTQPQQFTEEQMTLFYTIADFTSQTISRFETIVAIEKGKLMAMIGSLADGVFMIDRNSQITVMNDAAKEYLSVGTKIPTIMDVLSALPNTYNFGNKIQQVMTENQPMIAKNIRVGDRFFEIFLTPVLDVSVTTEEKVIGASILLHDVTLEESVAQMKEDFTNIIVHELRSPLTSIKASSQLLTSHVELNEQEKTRLIRLISEQTSRLLDEVSLILDTAKLESGLFKIQKTISDIKEVIQERVSTFVPQGQSKQITITTALDEGIPTFSFDPHQVGQVINNLLSNSLKFTPAGGTIRVSARKIKNMLEVAVSDTGPGIPKEKQHLLFSKFTQLASPNAHVGTGLGLYFVKGVINAHGGEVALDSEVGRGTTISFTIPVDIAHIIPTDDHIDTANHSLPSASNPVHN